MLNLMVTTFTATHHTEHNNINKTQLNIAQTNIQVLQRGMGIIRRKNIIHELYRTENLGTFYIVFGENTAFIVLGQYCQEMIEKFTDSICTVCMDRFGAR